MIRVNENFFLLKASYLFHEIEKREKAFRESHPEVEVIKLGIGDVTLPLPQVCIEAFHKAVDDLSQAETFKGYGPYAGYEFVREAIAEHEFRSRGAQICADEIFLSDGSKSDSGNFQELFAKDCVIAVQDPVYPAYVDCNVMAGRTGEGEQGRYRGIYYMDCTSDRGYLPELPTQPVDLIYLCFPNNPTGAVATKEELTRWVRYAKENNALILFDAAYAAFLRSPEYPESIFEIEGAKEVAVEFRSFSKNAGFTGVRCAFTVIPKECRVFDSKGNAHMLNPLWLRRQSTRYNGVSYPVQRAAAAIYSDEGKAQVRALTDYYLVNAKRIRNTFRNLGFECVGGDDAPYIWINVGKDSWDMFEELLSRAGVVSTPGSGFGACGQGHIRLSSFNTHENVEKALERIANTFR